ncbi:hypothetical protein PGTUg99_036973 [Puccinia graminis f. sp. tritici]|nr:hypothetical protein PGTUg99_036973 [Puccinia graminis f. sp. tritici]
MRLPSMKHWRLTCEVTVIRPSHVKGGDADWDPHGGSNHLQQKKKSLDMHITIYLALLMMTLHKGANTTQAEIGHGIHDLEPVRNIAIEEKETSRATGSMAEIESALKETSEETHGPKKYSTEARANLAGDERQEQEALALECLREQLKTAGHLPRTMEQKRLVKRSTDKCRKFRTPRHKLVWWAFKYELRRAGYNIRKLFWRFMVWCGKRGAAWKLFMTKLRWSFARK